MLRWIASYFFLFACGSLKSFIPIDKTICVRAGVASKGSLSLSASSLNFGELAVNQVETFTVSVGFKGASSLTLYAQSTNGGMKTSSKPTSLVLYTLHSIDVDYLSTSSAKTHKTKTKKGTGKDSSSGLVQESYDCDTLKTKSVLGRNVAQGDYEFDLLITSLPQNAFGTFTDTLTFTLEEI